MKRRKNRTKKNRYVLYAILLLLSVGYAAFSTTLKLRGSFGILATDIGVIWQNPKLTEGSVAGEITIDDETKTEVSFTANLQKPGDFHEFTIEARNTSNNDAMLNINTVTFYQVESGVESEIDMPSYLTYSFIYSDGVKVERFHKLKANSVEKYKIRLEIKRDIDVSELPSTPTTITTDVSTGYIYADDRAKDRNSHSGETIALLKKGTTINNMMLNMVEETKGYDYEKRYCAYYNSNYDYEHDDGSIDIIECFNNSGDRTYMDQRQVGLNILSISKATKAEYNRIKNTLTNDNLISLSTSNSKYNDYHIATSVGVTLEGIIPDSSNALPVYMWYDSNSKTIYYYTEADKIYMNEDSTDLFRALPSLNHLDLSDFDSSRVVSMDHMFSSTDVRNIDLSYLNTSNVMDMDGMFSDGFYTTLDLSSWDTSNLTSMEGIFSNDAYYIRYKDEGHNIINISNWDLRKIRGDEIFVSNNHHEGSSTVNTLILDNVIFGEHTPNFGKGLTKYISLANVDTTRTKNMSYMFEDCGSLLSLDLSSFDTSKVTDMRGMFSNCSGLKSLDLSSFDTSSVTDMAYMFYYNTSLSNLNLGTFDTGQVTTMEYMFYDCRVLAQLNTISFDTSNVTDMNYMFYNCDAITGLDSINFNTLKVESMEGMFRKCSGLVRIDAVGFDTRNVKYMSYMFADCENLSRVDTIRLNTNSVTSMNYMFYNCDSLTKVDSLGFDTSNVVSMRYMFSSCDNLTIIDIRNFDTTSLKDMSYMFYKCNGIMSIDLSYLNIDNVTSMSNMFSSCDELRELYLTNITTSNLTNISSIFSNSEKLEKVDLSNFRATNLKNTENMFGGCYNLKTVILDGFYTNNVTDMSSMFYGCTNLVNLNLSNLNTSSVKYMERMFYDCSSLTNLNLSSFNTSSVTNMSSMFYGCSSLTNLNLSSFNTSSVTNMSSMFYGCSSLRSINLSNFNTDNLYYISSMFQGCSSLISIDLSNFNISNVTSINNLFKGCSSLTSIDFGNFNTSNVNSMESTFQNCTSLTRLDISSFDTSKVSDIYRMFSGDSNLTTIYVSNTWTTEKVGNSTYSSGNVFTDCNSIVGGNGTTYDANHIDKEYARIDTVDNPGYFTYLDSTATYRIRFDANGGTVSQTSKIINRGDPIGNLPTPTYSINEFDGWYEDLQTGIEIDSTYIPNGDITLHAKWNLYDGWYFENESDFGPDGEPLTSQKWQYYDNGIKIENGLRYLNGRYQIPGESMHNYLFKDGYMYMGWYEEYGNKYYFSTFDVNHNGYVEGFRFEDTTKTIDGISYHFDDDGVCTNCGWYFENKDDFDSTGQPVKNQKWKYSINGVTANNDLLYVDGSYDGLKVGNHWHLFRNGYMYMGWYQDSQGYRYFFDDTAGAKGYARGYRLESTSRTINGIEYQFNENGACTKNCEHAENILTANNIISLDFATSSWTDIVTAYNSGNRIQLYQAMRSGKTREVQLDLDNDGTPETTGHLRIANLSTPAECSTQGFSQSACGFVVEFTDVITTHQMNPSGDSTINGYYNKGGWKYSDMRAYLNSTTYTAGNIDYSTSGIYNALPSDLKNKIISTTIVSGYGNNDSENFTTQDKLYLLDSKEIYGDSFTDTTNTAKDVERQLDYYGGKGVTTSNYSSIIKKNSSNNGNSSWRLRSAYYRTNNNSYFHSINYRGQATSTYSDYNDGVSPAFRLSAAP